MPSIKTTAKVLRRIIPFLVVACLLIHACRIRSLLTTYLNTKFREPIIKKNSSDKFYNYSKHSFHISSQTHGVDCRKLFSGNLDYINKIKQLDRRTDIHLTAEYYISSTKNCVDFVRQRGYITDYLTQEEKDFPIAYSILLYKDIEQAERLLRAIYRPQNFYCIHIDNKAHSNEKIAIQSISNCFDNVFMASPLINVKWGEYSVLQADIICMKHLVIRRKWKYFINLTGQEFPLRTNLELVKILQSYNGANDVDGSRFSVFEYRWEKTLPPNNAVPTMGSIHVVVNRQFVEYIVYNQTAKDILRWTKDKIVPDELYFSTLNHSPQLGIKGSYLGRVPTGELYKVKKKQYMARLKNWGDDGIPCAGKLFRDLCIFGIGDLQLLQNRRELFANKFHLDYEPSTLDCLEELVYNRTRDQYLYNITFDSSYYKNLDFVKYKL